MPKKSNTVKSTKTEKVTKTKSEKTTKATKPDAELIELQEQIAKVEAQLRKLLKELSVKTCEPLKSVTISGPAKKKVKDPNAPVKPKTSYLLFAADTRAKIAKANPSFSFGEIAKEVSKLWKEATAETKKKYEKKAAPLAAAYKKELEKYREETGVSEDGEKLLKKIQKSCAKPDTYYNVYTHKHNTLTFTEKGKPKGKSATLAWYQLNDLENIRICGNPETDSEAIEEMLKNLGFEDAEPTFSQSKTSTDVKTKPKGKAVKVKAAKGKAGKKAQDDDEEEAEEDEEEVEAEEEDVEDEVEDDEEETEDVEAEEEEVEEKAPKKKTK